MDITMLIDGAEAESEGKAQFERLNPVTGKVATRAPAAGRADVDRAVEAAAAAFPAWAATGPNARRAILLKAADVLDARTPEFIETAMAETGATGPWIGFNVFFAAQMLREAAAMTTQVAGEIIPSDKPGTLAMALREPVGVLVGMAPWNAPVILGVRAVAMPLACGNTVVLQGLRDVPGDAPADRRDPERRRAAEGRPQHHHPFGRRRARGRLGADRASEGAPDQLHRLDPGRAGSSPSRPGGT